MPKLTYAIKNNSLVHVSSVPSGLACECTCPSCGGQLVAKKGISQIHHFAHYDVEECKAGYETSLHLLAKSIISEYKTVLIPAVYLVGSDPRWKIAHEKHVLFDEVVLEISQGNMIPDIIGSIGDKQLYIEIRVSHAVDEVKKTKIIERGVSCVEIDLSGYDGEINRETLANYLMSDSSRSKWIFNAHSNQYQKALALFQREINLLHRGFALHAETCPIPARTWNGIAYANFNEDCAYCPFLRDYKTTDQDHSNYYGSIFCSGESKVGCFEDLKQLICK